MNILERVSFVLQQESKAIAAIKVDSTFEDAVLALASCKGRIVTTGIGKAGNVAANFASTLRATATAAYYMHPADAAHGDLGAIKNDDCLVAFSTSGKSVEVISAVKMAKELGIKFVIGVTSHIDSEIRPFCDLVIDMGPIKEPCPLGLTPTSSAVVMHAICDALTLSLLEQKGVSESDFGARHHGGYLGQRSNQ